MNIAEFAQKHFDASGISRALAELLARLTHDAYHAGEEEGYERAREEAAVIADNTACYVGPKSGVTTNQSIARAVRGMEYKLVSTWKESE